MKAKRAAKRVTSYRQTEKAKSAVVAQLVRIARKARLGYDDFLYISQQARKKLGLRRHLKPYRNSQTQLQRSGSPLKLTPKTCCQNRFG
jgi:hypothetical protein